MDNTTNRVEVLFEARFVRKNENLTNSAGNPVKEVTLPEGVVLGGQDLAGVQFQASAVDYHIDANSKVALAEQGKNPKDFCKIIFYTGDEKYTLLRMPERDENGAIVRNERGYISYLPERVKADNVELVAALKAYENKRVYITFNKFFVEERTNSASGQTFYQITLPKGIVIDGRDFSGARFTTNYLNDLPNGLKVAYEENDAKPDNYRQVSYRSDYNISLKLPVRGEDGRVREDEVGTWIYETVEVSPTDLRQAMVLWAKETAERLNANKEVEQETPAQQAPEVASADEPEIPFGEDLER